MTAALTAFVFLSLIATSIVVHLLLNDDLLPKPTPESLRPQDKWFGAGARKAVPQDVKPFKVAVADQKLKDLKILLELNLKNLPTPMENATFQYGFNGHYLREVVTYWKDKYDWRRLERSLNKLPQFTTNIDGLDIHFVHVKPSSKVAKEKTVVPLLMVHGWPGSFLEFLKILPLLTEGVSDSLAFEVIAPSIPGYGFSSAAVQEGLDANQAARMFRELMRRLGHNSYYTQAGDWGAAITSNMATLYPESVRGLHTNFAVVSSGASFVKRALGSVAPWLFSVPDDEQWMLKDFGQQLLDLVIESGYLHIQATKPDTLGAAIETSPAGLAAWILEKVALGADLKSRDKIDGGLPEVFQMDELLDNVMLYWVTGTATSAGRFYLENLGRRDNGMQVVESLPLLVPTGVAIFPNEIVVLPRFVLKNRFRNIVSYTQMPRGGHFAAWTEPKLLAADLTQFVDKVEKSR